MTDEEMCEALLEIESFLERVTDWVGGDIASRQEALQTLRAVYLHVDGLQRPAQGAQTPRNEK